MKLKTVYRKAVRYVPLPAVIIFILTVITGIINLIMLSSESFADFFNTYISGGVRHALAFLTNNIPFSLAETFVIMLPAVAVIVMIICIRAASKSWRRTIRCITGMLSSVFMLYIIFVWSFAGGYNCPELDKKIDLERRDVSAEELAYTAGKILEDMDEVIDEIDFKFASSSIMPYSYDELNDKLMEAYDSLCVKYDFLHNFHSRFKTIALSEPMTYTHISGIYSFFTGEANVNINYPDYIIPYTAAHELAHQRGIARENEANFIAFTVCMESDDPYIRYSALLSMYEYVISALYKASEEYYYDISSRFDLRARGEMIAYSNFFDKYRENTVSDISGAVNNTYLIMQGTEGTKSYGMVVDLAVAYYMS